MFIIIKKHPGNALRRPQCCSGRACATKGRQEPRRHEEPKGRVVHIHVPLGHGEPQGQDEHILVPPRAIRKWSRRAAEIARDSSRILGVAQRHEGAQRHEDARGHGDVPGESGDVNSTASDSHLSRSHSAHESSVSYVPPLFRDFQ